MSNDIIEYMREVIEVWDARDDANKEIRMWRERFLNEIPKYNDAKHAAKVWMSFLSIPTSKFIKQTPQSHIKEIENFLELFK